jgi:four helix bundle protein
MPAITSYRDLQVWQRAMELATTVYQLEKSMPKSEEYRLAGQMLRAAGSGPANIAEGHMRGTRKDYANFVSVARGSRAELESFLMLVERVRRLTAAQTGPITRLADEGGRMLRQCFLGAAASPSPNQNQPQSIKRRRSWAVAPSANPGN